MPTPSEAIDAAIHEVTAARSMVSKIKMKQIKGMDAIASLKATAETWFYNHRPVITTGAPTIELDTVDTHYTTVLDSTAKLAARQTYLTALLDAKTALITIRTTLLTSPAPPAVDNTDDLAPDFSPLAGNEDMRSILTRRWHECCKCVTADAQLGCDRHDGRPSRSSVCRTSQYDVYEGSTHQRYIGSEEQGHGQDPELPRMDAGLIYQGRPRTALDYRISQRRGGRVEGIPQLHSPREGATTRRNSGVK